MFGTYTCKRPLGRSRVSDQGTGIENQVCITLLILAYKTKLAAPGIKG